MFCIIHERLVLRASRSLMQGQEDKMTRLRWLVTYLILLLVADLIFQMGISALPLACVITAGSLAVIGLVGFYVLYGYVMAVTWLVLKLCHWL